jgi:hypothetical protein
VPSLTESRWQHGEGVRPPGWPTGTCSSREIVSGSAEAAEAAHPAATERTIIRCVVMLLQTASCGPPSQI